MTYEDVKILANAVNDRYGYYEQHGKGEECEAIKRIVMQILENANNSFTREEALHLFQF